MESLTWHLVGHLRACEEVHVFGPYAGSGETEEHTARPGRPGLAWFFLSAVVTSFRLLRRVDVDAIVAGTALVMPIVYVLGRMFGLPIAVNVHGLDLIYPHPLYQLMVRLLLRRFDRVVANSQASRTEALERGASPAAVVIVHPGLDFSEFAEQPDQASVRRRLGLEKDSVLLTVGRLAKRKGIPEFVMYALPEIVRACPDVVLLVIGGNPTESLTHKQDTRAQIEGAAEDRQLEAHVRLLGRVERDVLVALYHACDVFVLPSKREQPESPSSRLSSGGSRMPWWMDGAGYLSSPETGRHWQTPSCRCSETRPSGREWDSLAVSVLSRSWIGRQLRKNTRAACGV
jgi:phosphatidylinositol alpha-1,6-mannosyltransferase